MCIILPVQHMACNHTTTVLRQCPQVTSSDLQGVNCPNTREHSRPIVTNKLCEFCTTPKLSPVSPRRNGIAERGRGSLSMIPESNNPETPQSSPPPTKVPAAEEEAANDSGYDSTIIGRSSSESDGRSSSESYDRPLSPKSTIPQRRSYSQPFKQRKRLSSSNPNRSPHGKSTWRPNLKRDWSLEHLDIEHTNRRDSSASPGEPDSLSDDIANATFHVAKTETAVPENHHVFPSIVPGGTKPRKQRLSTLLHPSTPPPIETTGHAQIAVAFAHPKVVEVHHRNHGAAGLSVVEAPKIVTVARAGSARKRERKLEMVMYASAGLDGDGVKEKEQKVGSERPIARLARKHCFKEVTTPTRVASTPAPLSSTLLIGNTPLTHESGSTPTIWHDAREKPLPASPQPQTVVSKAPLVKPIPRRASTLLHPSPSEEEPQPVSISKSMPKPLLRTTKSEPQSSTLASLRRASVLHSSMSDSE